MTTLYDETGNIRGIVVNYGYSAFDIKAGVGAESFIRDVNMVVERNNRKSIVDGAHNIAVKYDGKFYDVINGDALDNAFGDTIGFMQGYYLGE